MDPNEAITITPEPASLRLTAFAPSVLIRTNLWYNWARIAVEHERDALEARAELKRVWKLPNASRDILTEMHPSMVAIVSCALAFDALHADVAPIVGRDPDPRRKGQRQWLYMLDTFKVAIPAAAKWHAELSWLIEQRDMPFTSRRQPRSRFPTRSSRRACRRRTWSSPGKPLRGRSTFSSASLARSLPISNPTRRSPYGAASETMSWPSSRNCATETARRRSSDAVSPRDAISRLGRARRDRGLFLPPDPGVPPWYTRPNWYRFSVLVQVLRKAGHGASHSRAPWLPRPRTVVSFVPSVRLRFQTTRLATGRGLWVLQVHSLLMVFAACHSMIYCNSYHVRWRLQ